MIKLRLFACLALLLLAIACTPAPVALPTVAPTAIAAASSATPVATATLTRTPSPSDTATAAATLTATSTATPSPTATASTNTPTATITPRPTRTIAQTRTASITRTATRTRTLTPTPLPTPPAQACARPPDDYTRLNLNGKILNARTWWMLKLADRLYQGRGSPLNINQGSYVNNVAASFGTHAGGGAVDIGVYVKGHPSELLSYDEEVELVHALREAGFAAWLRLKQDLTLFNGEHIHAIAIGDRELSPEARRQLDGPEGYFRGLDGVPPDQGGTKPDRYGGPIVCGWMEQLGFHDLRGTPTTTP